MNLGVGEIGFMFGDLCILLKKTSLGDINLTNLPCLTYVLPGDTSNSQYSSLETCFYKKNLFQVFKLAQ